MNLSPKLLHDLIFLAGLGQLALVLASLAIPHYLRWKEELGKFPNPFFRQIFRVYSVYIWGTNLAFGLLSALRPSWLLQKNPLAAAVCGFICLYWTARVFIQIFYFDRSQIPKRPIFKAAEVSLLLLFLFLSLSYGAALYFQLT